MNGAFAIKCWQGNSVYLLPSRKQEETHIYTLEGTAEILATGHRSIP